MNAVYLLLGLLLMGTGLLFQKGHAVYSVWKAVPEEKRERIDIRGLCTNVGTMILLCGMILFMAGISADFKETFFGWDMALWLIAGGIDAVYISRSGRFIRP